MMNSLPSFADAWWMRLALLLTATARRLNFSHAELRPVYEC
jgi:hypothetical protein